MAVATREIKKNKSFVKEPSFTQFIPYSQHLTPTIVSTVGGEYVIAFRIQGRTHASATDETLRHWVLDLNHVAKQIGNEHVKIWTHLHHHKIESYPAGEFPTKFARDLNAKYRKMFDKAPLMVNDWYLTVVYNPVGDIAQQFLSKFDRPSREQLEERQKQAIEKLEDISTQLMGAMSAYSIEPLTLYYRDKNGNIIEDADSAPDIEDDAPDDDDPEGDLLAELPADEPASVPAEPVPLAQRHVFSRVLEWFSFLANGEWSIVPVCRGRICDYLMTNRPVSSLFGDVIELRAVERNLYMAGIEVHDFEENTEPGQLNLLMEAPYEYVLTQVFCCMSRAAGRVLLRNQQLSMMETNDPSKSQTEELSTARDDVAAGRIIMGFYYAVMHVVSLTADGAQQTARQAKVMMNQCGISAGAVSLASDAAFYSRLPGNTAWMPRPVPVNSWNLFCFSSFHNFISGKPTDNPWGRAIMLFRGVSGSPLFLNFHSTPKLERSFGKRPAGVTGIFGRIGSGKTTTLNALLTFSTEVSIDPRMAIYDRDRGMYPLVKALHGHYTVLKEGLNTGWQPLQLTPTLIHIAFVKRLLRVLCEITLNGKPMEQPELDTLNSAIDAVMGPPIDAGLSAAELEARKSYIPMDSRTLTAVMEHCEKPHRTSAMRLTVAAMLLPWTRHGEYGWLFDNDADLLDFRKNDINAFDLTEFLVGKDEVAPVTRTPMLMYLNFRVRETIDGKRRFIQVFDEFAQYLDDPIMVREVKRGIKNDRKKDCIYVFSTQEPNDAISSTIGKTIIQQMVTQVLLENRDADREDYGDRGLKCPPADIDAVMSIPENSRQFLIRQGGQSGLASMKLEGMDEEISILSGTPDNADRLEKLIRDLGTDDPDVWLPKYYAAVVGRKAGR
ncbi:type IV secretion system protein VirB4 [Paraburkholderia sp. JPY465]|uniref:VirB4 family type IV secretion/conjugal transfer ATPase n=1 Tax=Paraburkholderia sp. JPY465 TaxID=3042285 RepID=UPI003D20E533